MSVAAFFAFTEERARIQQRRVRDPDRSAPWTSDATLATYRFCNVRREDDRVTRWLVENWYGPHAGDEPHRLWFAAFVARRAVNWPDTLEEVGFPGPRWDKHAFRARLRGRLDRGEKTFNSAYRIPTGGCPAGRLPEAIAEIAGAAWARRREFDAVDRTLAAVTAFTATMRACGPFYGYQVALDLMTTPVLSRAADRATYAAVGPGSARGLNRVFGRPLNARVRQDEGLEEVLVLCEAQRMYWPSGELPQLRACDVEHSLCEFDKYERIRAGEGQMRRFA